MPEQNLEPRLTDSYSLLMVTQNMLRTYEVKWVSSAKKIGFDDSFDVTKCFKQIEIPYLLHMLAY